MSDIDYETQCDEIIRRLQLPTTSINELVDSLWSSYDWWNVLEIVKSSGWDINQLNAELKYRKKLLSPQQLQTIQYKDINNCGIPGFELWKVK